MTTQALTLSQARRIALAAQGFGNRKDDGVSNWRRVRAAIDRMGLLQMDSIRVTVRSHYLPVYSRAGPYDMGRLDEKAFHPRKRELFEYWAHEASLLPMAMHPLLRWRMKRAERFEGIWKGIAEFCAAQPEYVESVFRRIRDHGPLSSRAFNAAASGGKQGGMWNRHQGKIALEYLFWAGRITAHSRRGFERCYDLTERVVPHSVLALPTPCEEDAMRELLKISARALGVAAEADLRDYFRLPAAESRKLIAELAEQGDIEAVTVEGWPKPAYMFPDAELPRRIRGTALLTPFDPIVWERRRTERLFNFHYRIEIYTPAPRRRYGYYVLPFLLNESLAARVDLKADRSSSTLRVLGAFGEASADIPLVTHELHRELLRYAHWLSLDRLVISDHGDLARPLIAEAGVSPQG